MIIEQVDLHLLEIPLARPLANPTTAGASICTLWCEIRTSEGIVGSGYGWSVGLERAKVIVAATELAAQFVIGHDPMRTEQIWSAYNAMTNFLGNTGAAMIGMSILDIALWDIRGKAAGQPLWLLLGGHKEAARIYMNLIDADPDGQAAMESLCDARAQAVERGFLDIKLRLGLNDPGIDIARLDALVEKIGSGRAIAVDLAQRWDSRTALSACSRIDDLGLLWIEDPGHHEDLAGMRAVVDRLKTPICTGENAYGLRDPRELIERVRPAYLMLDLQRCGGISGWRKAAALAEAAHLSVTPHTYPHLGAHLVCGTANAPIGEHIAWWDPLFGGDFEIDGGLVRPPAIPGNGLEIDASRLGSAVWRRSVK